jgi:hypothetical protein
MPPSLPFALLPLPSAAPPAGCLLPSPPFPSPRVGGPTSNKWSAPAFVRVTGVEFGLVAGMDRVGVAAARGRPLPCTAAAASAACRACGGQPASWPLQLMPQSPRLLSLLESCALPHALFKCRLPSPTPIHPTPSPQPTPHTHMRARTHHSTPSPLTPLARRRRWWAC